LKFGQVNLFKAVKNNDKWTTITPLPFNDKKLFDRICNDSTGRILYFASNIPGCLEPIFGKWLCADGTGTPIWVQEVNTEADENFPFYSWW
jgi:hypothetical protein